METGIIISQQLSENPKTNQDQTRNAGEGTAHVQLTHAPTTDPTATAMWAPRTPGPTNPPAAAGHRSSVDRLPNLRLLLPNPPREREERKKGLIKSFFFQFYYYYLLTRAAKQPANERGEAFASPLAATSSSAARSRASAATGGGGASAGECSPILAVALL